MFFSARPCDLAISCAAPASPEVLTFWGDVCFHELFLRSIETDNHLFGACLAWEVQESVYSGRYFWSCFRILGSTADTRAHASVQKILRGFPCFGLCRVLLAPGNLDITSTGPLYLASCVRLRWQLEEFLRFLRENVSALLLLCVYSWVLGRFLREKELGSWSRFLSCPPGGLRFTQKWRNVHRRCFSLPGRVAPKIWTLRPWAVQIWQFFVLYPGVAWRVASENVQGGWILGRTGPRLRRRARVRILKSLAASLVWPWIDTACLLNRLDHDHHTRPQHNVRREKEKEREEMRWEEREAKTINLGILPIHQFESWSRTTVSTSVTIHLSIYPYPKNIYTYIYIHIHIQNHKRIHILDKRRVRQIAADISCKKLVVPKTKPDKKKYWWDLINYWLRGTCVGHSVKIENNAYPKNIPSKKILPTRWSLDWSFAEIGKCSTIATNRITWSSNGSPNRFSNRIFTSAKMSWTFSREQQHSTESAHHFSSKPECNNTTDVPSFILCTALSAIPFVSDRWRVDIQWFHDRPSQDLPNSNELSV